MRIVICEDEAVYQTVMLEAIDRWRQKSGHADVEVSVFSSSEDLLARLEQRAEIDLLFMDIQIPGEMSGIELARRIRDAYLDVAIVFCTNYSEYVYEGYTVNALRFLKKPVVQEDVDFCCSYVYNRMAIRSEHALTFFSSGKRHVLRYLEIRCIEARLHSLLFYTTLGEEPLRMQARLSDLLLSLPSGLFVRCHRSYIVNIAHVRTLTRTECVLSDNVAVPISRTFSQTVDRAFDQYHQGGRTLHDLDSI